jgi:hypothetical protein
MRKYGLSFIVTITMGCGAFAQNPAPRIVDLKAADGTPLKATYFAAAKSVTPEQPGPQFLGRGSRAAWGGWLQHCHARHAWIRREQRKAW